MVLFRVAERRCLGINRMFLFAHIGMMEDVQAPRIGSHDAVFMPLCTIFTKWPAPLARSEDILPQPFRSLSPCPAFGKSSPVREKGFENRIQNLHRLFRPADHETIPRFNPRHRRLSRNRRSESPWKPVLWPAGCHRCSKEFPPSMTMSPFFSRLTTAFSV